MGELSFWDFIFSYYFYGSAFVLGFVWLPEWLDKIISGGAE